MHRLLILLVVLAVLLLPAHLGVAQAKIEFSDLSAFYKFGESITFQATIQPPSTVTELLLFIRPEGQDTILEPVALNDQGELIHKLDLKRTPLRPFTRVEYWLRASTLSGEKVESTRQFFFYEENFQAWQHLEEGSFSVNWRVGDQKFGQAVLNAALSGMLSVNTYLPLVAPSTIRIYVYQNARDLQSALLFNQQTWVAGHTSPDLGVILVSVAPGLDQQLEMERQIPHELAHIALYQLTGNAAFDHLPAWLNEGISSLAELNPNSEYRIALERSAKSGHIISMETLCGSFPTDASSAFLAYAQSASFVRFYFQKFGATGLAALINQYKNGVGCLEGVQAASGVSLAQLQSRWQEESLGINTSVVAIQNLAPYLVIAIILLLVPLSLGLRSVLHHKA